MKTTILATGAALVALSASASAQDDWQAGAGGVTQLDRITVTTPLRRESALDRSTSSVTVIDQAAIERSAAADLTGLLASYPGVTVTRRGGLGSDTSISLRGTKAAQTLVLVNGVSAKSATLGTTTLFAIPLSAIERIEIAKGAHSAQYGSDAIGGVVNIITKRGGGCDNGRSFCTTVTAGVTHPWGGTAGVDIRGETADGLQFALGGHLLGTRGYNFTTPDAFAYEPDDDGFLQGAGYLSLSKDFEWGRLYADGLYSRARTAYDNPGADNESDTDNFAGKLGARLDHTADWSTTFELVSAVDYSRNFRQGTPIEDRFGTRRYGIFAATEKSFETGPANHVVQLGGELYREEITSTNVYAVRSRNLAAAFGQYTLEYDALTIDAGLRHDHNQQFGGATTYNLGASYEVLPDLTLRASHATGFRAPTFNDLYWPADPWTAGNPDLRPERSNGYEVGATWRPLASTAIDLAFYQTWIRDQINWAPDAAFVFRPFNVERVRITGFEAAVDHRFDQRWSGRLSIDIRDPRDAASGRVVVRQERFKAAAELTFSPMEQLDLTARVLHVGSRFEDTANTVVLDPYTTVDFSALYRIDDRTQARFSVENLLDAQYQTARGYRSPGRTISASLSRTF